MTKGFANAVNTVLKQANANAARCVCVWAALALREEGYEREGIVRVLNNILKYSRQSCGKVDIQDQLNHIAKACGLNIVWASDDTIRIEELDDWDDYDTETYEEEDYDDTERNDS